MNSSVQICSIKKSVVRNPVEGVVLTRYAEKGELTAYGKPLYKIANHKRRVTRCASKIDQASFCLQDKSWPIKPRADVIPLPQDLIKNIETAGNKEKIKNTIQDKQEQAKMLEAIQKLENVLEALLEKKAPG